MLIKGYIDSFLFKNPEETFGVFNIISNDVEGDECICVGMVRSLTVGLHVSLEGEFVEHKKFGHQFKFSSFQICEPEGTLSIERYLASGAIKGIGPKLAIRIVKKFGEETLTIMEEQPERLSEIRGISDRIAMEIAAQMAEQKDVRDALMYLQGFGITNNMAVKIYDYYKTAIYSIIKENPYKIAEDISGIGFKKVDELAMKSGFLIDSEDRIKAGIHFCLVAAQGDGHTYLPKDVLFARTLDLLAIDTDQLDKCLMDMYIDGKVFVKDEKVTLDYIQIEEMKSALALKRLLEGVDDDNISEDEAARRREVFNDYTEKLKEREGIVLDDDQLEAVYLSTHSGVFILTGGPGTGKTTTISAMIHYFLDNGMSLSLAAPTGRAAKRMEERTGYVAKTIHRLLEVNGVGDTGDMPRFNRNEENPLDTDVVIVDEMSMVDIHMLYSLLCAMTPGMRLIMCGDSNQLPSVGPGNVLKDMLNSGVIPKKGLEKIYRQQDGSEIIINAHMINKGQKPALTNEGNDFFFLERGDVGKLYKDTVILLRDKLPRKFGCNALDIQVLCPAKKGPYGVEAFNKILQANLNPPSIDKPELIKGDTIFRLGDKVMQMKNDYNATWVVRGFNNIAVDEGEGVFNGDVGVVSYVDKASGNITVKFEDNKEVEYTSAALEDLELSYAITIHKSQGSEYPVIIMPIVDGPQMLFNRNLLYTGVTRAIDCVMILGSKNMVYSMVDNVGEYKRYCDFITKLKEVMDY